MHSYDSINEALIDLVKALGGSKRVGPELWPEKTVEAAQRHLLACLSDSKPERLTPDHLLLLLRLGRKRGHHMAIGYVLETLGYAPTQPVQPKDESADLQRQFVEAVRLQQALVERMEAAAQRIGDAQ